MVKDTNSPSEKNDRKQNRLGQEKSPYLLQHAWNPVDWYPWGEEAFEKARREEKPIFLSVGYSTCYWCHVMEREIFENESIAAMMNRDVVSIKVDREERPDIDRVYMAALQGMTGSGGWPMSIFMTADRKPFFAATYIPPNDQGGRAGFVTLLGIIMEAWRNERPKIINSSEQIQILLNQAAHISPGNAPVTAAMLDNAFEQWKRSFDPEYGGFTPAPKFPAPAILSFLLRYHHRTGNDAARAMVLTTLNKMAAGGIYDQLGGGFHRYSTDERWLVPHFEKMLYDQAQLVMAYLEAFQLTHDPFFARIVHETLAYVQRVMVHPSGGFYSAEDAESLRFPHLPAEKKEGAFYLWQKDEIDTILTPEESALAEAYYNVSAQGNIAVDPRNEFSGENILFRNDSSEPRAETFGNSQEDMQALLIPIRQKLFAEREHRPKPCRDEKLLLSWNGLMISAFARAYQTFGNQSYLSAAEQAAEFLLTHLQDQTTGTMLRRYSSEDARYAAQLSDYAFFVQGLLDLYEASSEQKWLNHAMEQTADQIAQMYDNEQGGFFDISVDDLTILVRGKEIYDNAEPSGNSIALLNILRMSRMLHNTSYRNMAEQSIRYFSKVVEQAPRALPQFLSAVDLYLSKPMVIILAGSKTDPTMKAFLHEIHNRFLPNKVVLFADGETEKAFFGTSPTSFKLDTNDENEPVAYICEDGACQLPVRDIHAFKELLDQKGASPSHAL